MARSGSVTAPAITPALLFLATGGTSATRRRRSARELLADLRARCEARGGACDCGMHRR